MYQFNLTESMVPAQTDAEVREITIGDLLREIAQQFPERTGLVEIDIEGNTARQWTYSELLADSEKLAKALASRFAPGERVTVWSPSTPEWVLMEYACALAGIIMVTANPAYQNKELRYVLEQSGSVALFLISEYRGNPMAKIGARACDELGSIREIVDMDASNEMQRAGERKTRLPEVSASDAAMIQYTSGTTGFPKGAVLSHRGLVNNARFYAGRLQTHPGTVWANIMPMFHTSGCGMVTLGCLQAGCKMLIIKLFDAPAIVRLIERERVSTILGVPTMLVALLESLEREPRDVSSVDMFSSGGAMVAPDLVRNIQRVFGCKFGILYGQTETSPVITQQDTVGEICVRGYCNMIEYHANEEATRETIDAQGWLHTGDLGTMDSRGYVRITGRVKEMIIRGGENMFPAEIENVLLEHPQITEVAVVGIPDEKWGEVIACFVRSETEHEIDIEGLRRHCRKNLSPQKTPTIWCQVAEFPMTGSGKIQKFLLRDDYLAGKYQPL
jgi:fatty-acyl-CoA synthase